MNDHVDEELAALYRAARAEEAPSRADRAAVRAALASTLVATGAASAHAAAAGLAVPAAKAVTIGKVAGWLCVGAALGGVTSSVAWVFTAPPPREPAPAVAASVVAAPARPSSPPPAKASAEAEAEAEPEPVSEPARVPVSAASFTASAPPRGPDEVPPSLVAESEGLLAIQRALSLGDAPRALGLLAEQEARFAGGALGEERAAVRVLALCAAGRLDQARRAREAFFAAHPGSPHGKRVLGSCAGR